MSAAAAEEGGAISWSSARPLPAQGIAPPPPHALRERQRPHPGDATPRDPRVRGARLHRRLRAGSNLDPRLPPCAMTTGAVSFRASAFSSEFATLEENGLGVRPHPRPRARLLTIASPPPATRGTAGRPRRPLPRASPSGGPSKRQHQAARPASPRSAMIGAAKRDPTPTARLRRSGLLPRTPPRSTSGRPPRLHRRERRRAIPHRGRVQAVRDFKHAQAEGDDRLGSLIGTGPPCSRFETIRSVAASDATVLIRGERHRQGARRARDSPSQPGLQAQRR
jgi:hypothetical protein